jgi:F-type H+-transporting ATPase subunit gamma
MEDIERIKERLDNIESVEPIITSLRTIAAGGWRLSMRRLGGCREYVEALSHVVAMLFLSMPNGVLQGSHLYRQAPPPRRALMLVIASERGLCGAFNDTVLIGADRLIAQQQLQSNEVLIATLGSRAERHFRRQGRTPHLAIPLPVTRVADFALVREVGETLIEHLQSGQVDAVYVIHASYKPATPEPPVSHRWLPVDAAMLPLHAAAWPEPVIETDRQALFQRTAREWTFAQLYLYALESAAAEQSARFRAMDAASANLKRIIGELTLSYHTARQHAITMEMLDLTAGSGILRGPQGRSRG